MLNAVKLVVVIVNGFRSADKLEKLSMENKRSVKNM